MINANIISKVLKDITTVANGNDYDLVRIAILVGIIAFIILSFYALIIKSQPWSPQDYGLGLGAILGGGGLGLKFKQNTEPN
jgi:hypothetical protein